MCGRDAFFITSAHPNLLKN